MRRTHEFALYIFVKGTHPEYEERLQQLIDKRQQTLEKAKLYRDYRLKCVEKMFDAETRQVEEDYLVYFTVHI
jgi:hypothetical protein